MPAVSSIFGGPHLLSWFPFPLHIWSASCLVHGSPNDQEDSILGYCLLLQAPVTSPWFLSQRCSVVLWPHRLLCWVPSGITLLMSMGFSDPWWLRESFKCDRSYPWCHTCPFLVELTNHELLLELKSVITSLSPCEKVHYTQKQKWSPYLPRT